MINKKKPSAREYASFWKKLAPEIKPLPAQLALCEIKIREILEKNKNPKALVLGVTPELRDLLAKYRIKTTCLDLNAMMISAMSFLVKKKNPNEKIIKGNWLKMPFAKNYFDIIISDMPQDNLKFKDFNIFFRNISKVLKTGGHWMTGTTHFEGRNEAINLNEYIKIYRKNPLNFKNQSVKLYYFLKLSGHNEFYNNKTKVADWIKIYDQIKKLYDNNKINKEELDDLSFPTDEIGLSLAVKFTWITRNEFLKLARKQSLYLLGFLEDDSNPAGHFRQTFIFRKL